MFNPPVFGHGKRDACLVGVRFALENVLLQRLMAYDTGTVYSGYRNFATQEQAEAEYQRLKDKKFFDTIEALIQKSNPVAVNEVMARLRWVCDPSSQICIFTNTLEARLLAQARDQDLYEHLKAQGIVLPEGYAIPISFYLPSSSTKVKYYTPEDQQRDRQAALQGKNCREKALALFCHISATSFDVFNEDDVLANLDELLAIVAKLSYSSSDVFFRKILLKIIDKCPITQANFWQNVFSIIHYEKVDEQFEFFKKSFPAAISAINTGYLMSQFDSAHIPPDKVATLSEIMEHADIPNIHARLLSAAKKGALNLVTIIIKNEKLNLSACDEQGYTALIWASDGGHCEVVAALVQAEAAVDAQDNKGRTALMWAAGHGHLEVVKILVAAGALLNTPDHQGRTALLWAAINGHAQVAEVLVKAGASLEVPDQQERTALMFAALQGHGQVAEVLVKAGASLDTQDMQGCTALMWAAQNGHLGVVNPKNGS